VQERGQIIARIRENEGQSYMVLGISNAHHATFTEFMCPSVWCEMRSAVLPFVTF